MEWDILKLIELNLRLRPKPVYRDPVQVLKDHLHYHLTECHTREIREFRAAIEVLSMAFE